MFYVVKALYFQLSVYFFCKSCGFFTVSVFCARLPTDSGKNGLLESPQTAIESPKRITARGRGPAQGPSLHPPTRARQAPRAQVVQGWFRGGSGAVQEWFGIGSVVPDWSMDCPQLLQVAIIGWGVVQEWFKGGSGVVLGWFRNGAAMVREWFPIGQWTAHSYFRSP